MAQKIVKDKNELTAAMDKVLKSKLAEVKEMMQKTIHEFLQLWYDDYTPSIYPRSFQLLNSCVSTGLVRSGQGYSAQVYIDYSNMNHMSYWKGKRPPQENRLLTEDEELKLVRLADGRNEGATTGNGASGERVQRGLTHPSENVVIGAGKHGVRFWSDAVNLLAGRENQIPYNIKGEVSGTNIYDAFEEFLRKKGFKVTRVSSTPNYFLPLDY